MSGMNVSVVARSISRPVWEQLSKGSFAAQVQAVFKHACTLVTPRGEMVAVVLSQVGNGPLNIVIDGSPADLAVSPGIVAWRGEGRLQIGELDVLLEKASVWDPRPDWKRLRACQDGFVNCLPLLQTLALHYAPQGSFLALVSGCPDNPTCSAVDGCLNPCTAALTAAQRAAQVLQAGWKGDDVLLQSGASQLAGLGGGLTPAGDDFLSGVMLWAWLVHPSPDRFCHLLVEAAMPYTTSLSAAFLRAAARGECSAAWHTLLTAIAEGTDEGLAKAVQDVLSHGATSGADALAGFLWAGLHTAA